MQLDDSNVLLTLDGAVNVLSDALAVRSPGPSNPSFGAHVNNNIRKESTNPSANQAKDARAELEAEIELDLALGDAAPKDPALGCMKGLLEIVGDIMSPIDVVWDATR